MLTAEGCGERRSRLTRALEVECDLLLVGDPKHLIYFANFASSPFEFRANDARALLVFRGERSTLIADNLLQRDADAAHVDEVIAPVWYNGKRSAPVRPAMAVETALEHLRGVPMRRIGVELSSVPTGIVEGLRSAHPGLEIVPLDPIIRPLRKRKDPDELVLLRKAIAAADAGFDGALGGVEPGMTEIEAFRLVQNACTVAAGHPVEIYGDFVSGPRCEKVGGPPSDRRIEAGELFLLDFSVVIHGYRGDGANTFVVGGGRASEKHREMFAACTEALTTGERALKAGIPAVTVDRAVRGWFEDRDLAGGFPSHAGHGIGLGHPEPPYFVPGSTDELEEGDVVTLEPGQYVAGVGGMRYERNYVITSEGFEAISRHRIAIER